MLCDDDLKSLPIFPLDIKTEIARVILNNNYNYYKMKKVTNQPPGVNLIKLFGTNLLYL